MLENMDYKSSALLDAQRYLKIDDLQIIAEKCDREGFVLRRANNQYMIHYSQTADLLKALGLISIHKEEITEIEEKKVIQHLGYLVDTARNAVPTLSTLKELMIRLATFGYDRLYLYTEDVMQIENEPFYGHMRGRYSYDELRQIDAYAAELGITVVPCIQTLAHLNCMFKWPEYMPCNDTADILLIGDPRTYELIENVFSTLRHCFTGRHVHIGLDEAYLVGRGKYMDKHGYENRYALLKRHIEIVMEIAAKYGFTTEIWSDMYFREAFDGGYYSATEGLSDEACAQIPKNVGLVYWDYFNRDERVIDNMFRNHIKTGNEVIFAGGAWKWSGWNPSNEMALVVGRKMLEACKKYDIQSVVLTAWSDDGAEASIFSTLPSIILYSQYAYGQSLSDESVDAVLKKQCGLSLAEYCVADLDFFAGSGREETYLFGTLPKILLYNDPLSGFYDGILQEYDLTHKIRDCRNSLDAILDKCCGPERKILEVLGPLCDVLEIKWDLGLRIRKAYREQNAHSLRTIAEKDIPELIGRLLILKSVFFEQWMGENKSNGFQTHDLRIGGLAERLSTISKLLISYLDGDIAEISELDEELLPMNEDAALDMLLWTTWKRIHSIYVM